MRAVRGSTDAFPARATTGADTPEQGKISALLFINGKMKSAPTSACPIGARCCLSELSGLPASVHRLRHHNRLVIPHTGYSVNGSARQRLTQRYVLLC
ncbi:hypothetical protein HA38_19480 [Pantoea allii]|nr:hypothetical protein HA38_19480 [Pantoea allii]PBK00512.1 hypothetical protein CMR03_10895 [Pantoea allii]